MFSVIFEVKRKKEHIDEYLDLANHLKPILQGIDGFVDNERFESQGRPGWLLSHSTWRDEKSVIRWRHESEHHKVQEKGRYQIFEDYHLRVGDVTFDSDPSEDAPVHELRFDETEIGAGKYATFTELTPVPGASFAAQTELIPVHLGLDLKTEGLVEHDVFSSIVTEGKLALLCSWKTGPVAKTWRPSKFDGVKSLRHRIVRVVRDYGMYDRREAPQFYPELKQA
jgi:heme-degrading monooxygenase HmoA